MKFSYFLVPGVCLCHWVKRVIHGDSWISTPSLFIVEHPRRLASSPQNSKGTLAQQVLMNADRLLNENKAHF